MKNWIYFEIFDTALVISQGFLEIIIGFRIIYGVFWEFAC